MAVKQGGETWSFEQHEGVGVWTIHDIEAFFESEVEDGQRHFQRTVETEGFDGGVVVLDDTTSLSREMQDHVSEAWSRVIAEASVDRVAFVSEGIRAMAVKANVEVPDTDLKALDDVGDALRWAQG